MKLKREKPDYTAIEDRRRVQRVNSGYKEDPEVVRDRLDISKHFQDRLKGKSDKELPDGLMEEMIKDGEKMQKRKRK